jgi:hypothetical protein
LYAQRSPICEHALPGAPTSPWHAGSGPPQYGAGSGDGGGVAVRLGARDEHPISTIANAAKTAARLPGCRSSRTREAYASQDHIVLGTTDPIDRDSTIEVFDRIPSPRETDHGGAHGRLVLVAEACRAEGVARSVDEPGGPAFDLGDAAGR